jgi:ubiquinone/menaquinone biosynthesis C-methylase UbiE
MVRKVSAQRERESEPVRAPRQVGRDRWARWLAEGRFGGDPQARARMLPQLAEFRDTVLAGARIRPGDVVLDVGCGDGLVGVGALDLVGDDGRVIFSDVSEELLDHCRALTAELGHADRCDFVRTALPDLAGIDTASVDVVTTRSVLIYVADKAGSFAAMHRVLRPGGRLSIFEPINRFGYPEPADRLWGFDITGAEELAARVKDAYRRYVDDTSPMLDFDERDLLALAEAVGFTEITLTYTATVTDQATGDWEQALRCAPNPLVPPLGEIVAAVLDADERITLATVVRRLNTNGRTRRRLATAHLTATRGPA